MKITAIVVADKDGDLLLGYIRQAAGGNPELSDNRKNWYHASVVISGTQLILTQANQKRQFLFVKMPDGTWDYIPSVKPKCRVVHGMSILNIFRV